MGAPPQYLGRYPRMAEGGAVGQPVATTLYGQGGEVDVNASPGAAALGSVAPQHPQLPATPSMEGTTTTGYAQGGNVLSAGQRQALPRSDFAVPGKAPGSGSYPMPDRAHAANAKARASQFGSPAVKSAVARKAKAKFGMSAGGSVPSTAEGDDVDDTSLTARPDPQRGRAAKPGQAAKKPMGRRGRVAAFEKAHGDEAI